MILIVYTQLSVTLFVISSFHLLVIDQGIYMLMNHVRKLFYRKFNMITAIKCDHVEALKNKLHYIAEYIVKN